MKYTARNVEIELLNPSAYHKGVKKSFKKKRKERKIKVKIRGSERRTESYL